MADPITWGITAVNILERLFTLVDHLSELKKKTERLNQICIAWERTGWLKDQLIRKYESDKITPERKRAAANIHRHLIKLQDALKELRKLVNRNGDNDRDIERQTEDIKNLIDRIIELFILM